MKNYAKKIASAGRKIEGFQRFWSRPHAPDAAARTLAGMRTGMDELLEMLDGCSKEEASSACALYEVLSRMFLYETFEAGYAPIPKDYCDDS